MLAGGSFGRRSSFSSDYIAEAAEIAKASVKMKGRPIHLVWTREDDIRGGMYRPSYLHKAKVGISSEKKISLWQHQIVGQSIYGMPTGIDPLSVEGVVDMPYEIPNLHVRLHTTQLPVPVLWWRSVAHTHTAFVVETLIDEMAALAGENPLAFRIKHLPAASRQLAVLKLATEKAQWGRKLPPGVGLGVAVHESFKSFVAQVAQVKVEGNNFTVQKVWCVVDCGIAVNPDVIKAQMEGGIGFALSAIKYGEITFNKGKVNQSNFFDYQMLRINEMPEVEVHIAKSSEAPTGVGEPGVPPLAPAIANAIFAVTGKRIRKLPIKLG